VAPSSAFSFDLSFFDSKLDANNYNRNYPLWGSHFINAMARRLDLAVVRNGTLVKANPTDPGTSTASTTRSRVTKARRRSLLTSMQRGTLPTR
jgi:hypothetical protein